METHRSEALARAVAMLDIADDVDRAAVVSRIEEETGELAAVLTEPKIRIKQLADLLNDIRRSAATLARQLDEYEEALVTGIGSRAQWVEFDETGSLQSRDYLLTGRFDPATLVELSVAAEAVRGAVVSEYGSDKGGPDLSTRLNGTPKRRFVEAMAWIWAVWRPDQLTEKTEGLMHQFVECCWEFATGDTKAPGIADDLRHIVPTIRSRQQYRREAWEQEALAGLLERTDRQAEAADCLRRAIELFRLADGGSTTSK